MEQELPRFREWADRILRREIAQNQPSEMVLEAIETTCGKLLPPFAKLLGERGYRTILSRALVLAGRRVSWLNEVNAGKKGGACLLGLYEAGSQRDAVEIWQAGEEIIVSLLTVLASFVGETLVLYELAQAYPEDFTDAEPGSERERRS